MLALLIKMSFIATFTWNVFLYKCCLYCSQVIFSCNVVRWIVQVLAPHCTHLIVIKLPSWSSWSCPNSHSGLEHQRKFEISSTSCIVCNDSISLASSSPQCSRMFSVVYTSREFGCWQFTCLDLLGWTWLEARCRTQFERMSQSCLHWSIGSMSFVLVQTRQSFVVHVRLSCSRVVVEVRPKSFWMGEAKRDLKKSKRSLP